MSNFKDRINLVISGQTLIGNEVHREYAVTGVGQEVAFVITSMAWYALRVYFDESHTDGDLHYVFYTQHWTLAGAKDQIKKYREQLSRHPPYFECAPHNLTHDMVCETCVGSVRSPQECSDNPDTFLKRGDHIAVRRSYVYNHDAIYAGNRMVYQISAGEGDSKSAKATTHAKHESWEKFTLNKKEPIFVRVYRIRRRTTEEIIQAAQQFCESCYGQGAYNFYKNNCQHFAARCCTGFDWSFEAHKSIRCVVREEL